MRALAALTAVFFVFGCAEGADQDGLSSSAEERLEMPALPVTAAPAPVAVVEPAVELPETLAAVSAVAWDATPMAVTALDTEPLDEVAAVPLTPDDDFVVSGLIEEEVLEGTCQGWAGYTQIWATLKVSNGQVTFEVPTYPVLSGNFSGAKSALSGYTQWMSGTMPTSCTVQGSGVLEDGVFHGTLTENLDKGMNGTSCYSTIAFTMDLTQ